MRPVSFALAAACATFSGCDEPKYDPESHWIEGELGEIRSGMTVAEAGGCSTAIVRPLSEQLIEEINCLRPGTLASFEHPNIQPSAVVFTSLQTAARDRLLDAVEARAGMRMNSALRTLPQGYLLYRWWQEGRCGIALAARPGRSRHESGLAIDIDDAGGWRPTLEGHAWRWFGDADPVHFDYTGGGTVDLAGLSVLAFQRLWNRNNEDDRIAEDGAYGPQTEARLRRSPVAGFPIGACDPQPPEPEPQPEPIEPEPQPDPVEPEPQPDPVEPEPQPDPVEPEPQPDPAEPEAQPEPIEPEPQPDPVEPAPQPDPEPLDRGVRVVDQGVLDAGVRDFGVVDRGVRDLDAGGLKQVPEAPARLVGGCWIR